LPNGSSSDGDGIFITYEDVPVNRIKIELPEAASKKLAELELAKMSAEDSMRSTQGRINSLPANATELRARLAVERDRHIERHRQLSMLVSRLNQWTVELRLPPRAALELAPLVDIKLMPGETVSGAVATVRSEIAGVQRELAAVRAAPLKRSSQQEAINAYLARLAQSARPRIGFDVRGNARVMWAEDMVTGKDDVLGLLAFVLGPEALLAAFSHDLEQEPEPASAVSPIEREKKLGEAFAALLSLERREESLVERAANDGIEVPRRPDASPLAVLGVAIVMKEARQVA
jgi:hypothetical protein